jgi:serine/threonine-protein kinase
VLIEEVRVPMGLRRFQTARLIGWQEHIPHAEFDQLMHEVKGSLARKAESTAPAFDTKTMLGKQVQNYELLSLLGQGGTGAVYLAVHSLLGRQVAIKILRREYAENPELVDRFINEAKAANAIRHAGIVQVIDVGTLASGLPYLVMELLAGETLRARIARGRVAVPLAIDIARQVAAALSAAHQIGIVHRDVKPENMFLVTAPPDSEHVKVLDFGIAKLTGAEFAGRADQTKTGVVMGTPPYMSPEQCRGSGEIDHRTDVYALGIILFEMLTGQQPFKAPGFGDLMLLHMSSPPPQLRSLNAAVSSELEAVVLRALEKRPEDRFQSMEEFAHGLADCPLAQSEVVSASETADVALGTRVVGVQVVDGDASPIATTISAAASEVHVPARPRAWVGTRTRTALATAAITVLIGGVAALFRSRQVPGETPELAAPLAVEPAREPEVEVHEPVAASNDSVLPAPPIPSPKRYAIRVTARPADAVIELDRVRVGSGEFTRELLADGNSHTLRFTRKGYATKSITFGETAPPPSLIVLDRLPASKPDAVWPVDTTPLK